MLPKYLITSLFFTVIIEVLLAFLLGIRKKIDYINVFLVNIMTNPMLVLITFLINVFWGLGIRKVLIIPLEIMVFLIEGFVYKKYLNYNKINKYVLSLILNAGSYLLGIIINRIIW